MKIKKNRYRPDWKKRRRILIQWIKEMFLLIFLVAGILGLSAAFTHSYRAMLESPWPCVEEIQITGLKQMERNEVLDALAVPRHANVFTLRMGELSDRLKTLPWVQSTVVRLDMPGRLVVEVTEREPLAIVYADDFFLLDTEGELFCRVDVKHHPELLLVTDFSDYDLHENDSLPLDVFETLRNLLAALEKAKQWLPLTHISECRWEQEEGFVLYTLQKAIPIRLGTEEFEQKLNRLYHVFGVLLDRQWWESVTRIDLDYSKRVYIEGDFPSPKGI
jgi:cell division septal protein FtsQ